MDIPRKGTAARDVAEMTVHGRRLWRAVAAEIIPVLVWIDRHAPGIGTFGTWVDRYWPRWLTFWNILYVWFVLYVALIVFLIWRSA